MSRQNYRKIDSISSLSLRCALLSYPHMYCLTVEYIRPRGHPFRTIDLTTQPPTSTLYAPCTREFPCNPPHKALPPGRRVLRISKRPEPVHHCSQFLVRPARTIELHRPTPKNTLRGNPGCAVGTKTPIAGAPGVGCVADLS
jgi:hypothetical protein